MERSVAIVDIDGVVADTRHRAHHLHGPRRDWDAFFAAAVADPVHPEGLAVVSTLAATHDVVLLTGRPARYRPLTERWLAEHGLDGHHLVMRPDGDRRPAQRFKLAAIDELRTSCEVAVVVDDDPDVLAAAAATGLATFAATWEV